jgi:hypothetical protein
MTTASPIILSLTEATELTTKRSSAYLSMMAKQRKLLYGRDYEAQSQAKQRIGVNANANANANVNVNTSDNKIEQKPKAMRKTWSLLSIKHKIQVTMTFIENLLKQRQESDNSQLRYLLISAISNKSQGEVDFNNGIVTCFHRLSVSSQGVYSLNDTACPPETRLTIN